jgi:quercetin dioxygenase-like cupin family protein
MNIIEHFEETEKDVFVKNILRDKGNATLIQIKKGKILKEHQSMTKALLILLRGKAVYEESGRKEDLVKPLDSVNIEPHISHKVSGEEDSMLLLIQ